MDCPVPVSGAVLNKHQDNFIFTENKNNYLNVISGPEDFLLRMENNYLRHELQICAVRVYEIVNRSSLPCGCQTSRIFLRSSL
jgi:hypothetical protein